MSPRSRFPLPSGHVIVAGAGLLGRQAVAELLRQGADEVVVIDADEERSARVRAQVAGPVTLVVGDATDDATLTEARVREAAGLIATLDTPRDNLFLCLSARQMSATLRIVSRVDDSVSLSKFERIGANAVVNPTTTGGQQLAHAMIHPELMTLAHTMAESEERTPLLLEVPVSKASPLAGTRLREADLEGSTGCAIIGLRRAKQQEFVYQPDGEERLRAGGAVVAVGDAAELELLERLLRGR